MVPLDTTNSSDTKKLIMVSRQLRLDSIKWRILKQKEHLYIYKYCYSFMAYSKGDFLLW